MLCASGLLVGCGSTAAPSAGAAPPSPAFPSPAVELLATFRPPPGAVRLPGEPSGAPQSVDQPAIRPGVDGLRISTAWWSVSGTPEQAQLWFTAHGPAGARPDSAGGGSGGGTDLFQTFAFPSQAGYQDRTLLMTAVTFHGATLLRVDAMEAHVGVRTTRDRIPSDVVRLVVRASTATAPKGVVLGTVTDAALIRQVATLTDALPLLAPGTRSCPNDTGGTLHLDFYAASGPPAATLIVGHTGCQTATITTTETFAPVNLEAAASDYQAHVLALLHLTFPSG